MSVEKSEINPRAYEQWDLWKVGVFGGLPWRAVLSCSPYGKDQESALESKDNLFLLTQLIFIESKILGVDYQLSIDSHPFPEEMMNRRFNRIDSKLYGYSLLDYEIPEQSIFKYLKNMPLKEELKDKKGELSVLICEYLNRDKDRMEKAFYYVAHERKVIESPKVKHLLKESFDDRASTIAQIEALSSIRVITPQTEENSTAGQESTLEGTTEAQSIEPPIEIQERFKKFVDDGILCIFPEPINGRKRYFLKSKSASDFFILFKKHQDKEKLPQMSARVLNEWIYRRTGKPYSKSSFYKHY